MTPLKQRIAIAEACGWKWVGSPEQVAATYGFTMPEKWVVDPNGALQFPHNTPDYLNDLNAMHDAEKVLKHQQWPDYWNWLFVASTRQSGTEKAEYKVAHASAAQRAEAFLRTIGKWEESE
jgi:hypothetical protein